MMRLSRRQKTRPAPDKRMNPCSLSVGDFDSFAHGPQIPSQARSAYVRLQTGFPDSFDSRIQ